MKWSTVLFGVTGTKSVPALMLSLRNFVEFIKRAESFQRVNYIYCMLHQLWTIHVVCTLFPVRNTLSLEM